MTSAPCCHGSGGFLFVEYPFFNVGLELSVPAVVTNPTLHAVQSAINVVAKQVILSRATHAEVKSINLILRTERPPCSLQVCHRSMYVERSQYCPLAPSQLT